MAETQTLREHMIDELTDLMDAEEQLTEALPKLAHAASTTALRNAFQKHLKETRGHLERLKKVFKELGEKAQSKTCEGMKGLLEEGNEMMTNTPEGALRDAVLITAAQKVEHYEMASYGTVRTYAQVLGEPAVARLLETSLREEKAADQKLTDIAESSVNEAAAEQWTESESEDSSSLVDRSSRLVRAAAASIGLGSSPSGSSSRTRRSPAGAPRRSGRAKKSRKSSRGRSAQRAR